MGEFMSNYGLILGLLIIVAMFIAAVVVAVWLIIRAVSGAQTRRQSEQEATD